VWPVAVRRCIFQGDFTQVHVGWGERELVVRCAGAMPLIEGDEAYLSVDPEHCVLLEGTAAPAASGGGRNAAKSAA
jgi:iron(III) transport system ATP-binding protein